MLAVLAGSRKVHARGSKCKTILKQQVRRAVILFVHYTYMPRAVFHKWLSMK